MKMTDEQIDKMSEERYPEPKRPTPDFSTNNPALVDVQQRCYAEGMKAYRDMYMGIAPATSQTLPPTSGTKIETVDIKTFHVGDIMTTDLELDYPQYYVKVEDYRNLETKLNNLANKVNPA